MGRWPADFASFLLAAVLCGRISQGAWGPTPTRFTNFARRPLDLRIGQQPAPPAPGTVLTGSGVFPRGAHRLPSSDLDHPAIVIRASNVTIDFAGATLLGAPASADPDSFTGVGVLVDGGENVTIRNVTARGYKVGVLVRRSRRVHITGSDLSYNWESRLYSLVEHESLVDWLSYHHNEKDEWLAGGAGIYVADSDDAEIDHTTIVQGQNGLMVVR